jgi:hypothetical protein
VIVFDCTCKWRFIVGKKRVYGPIYPIGLPGHYNGEHGCHSRGRMLTREEFEENYSDCNAQLWREAEARSR